LDRVFTTKKPHVSDFTYQGRYYQSILAPEFNSTRHVNSVIAATRDVTELRQLEKRKDEFLSIASHELKTPLSSIKAYSQILQQSYASFSTDQRVAILSKQNQHIDRLNRLISDLLDLSRIQSGRFQFTYTVFDFDTVVRESVESVQSFTTSHRLVIKGSVGLKVKADRHRLEQVLVNLLANAIKYSPDSNRVIIRQSVDNGCVVVSVQDFGIGIALSDQKHIFQRFYRTPAVEKQYSGLGIGLYISDQIIRRHKGKLTFTSTPNKGSVFKFSLPLNHLKPHD
jgi:signal transduction histidine kinase